MPGKSTIQEKRGYTGPSPPGEKFEIMKQKSNQADLFTDQPQNTTEMENKEIEKESQYRIKKLREMSKQLKHLIHGSSHNQNS